MRMLMFLLASYFDYIHCSLKWYMTKHTYIQKHEVSTMYMNKLTSHSKFGMWAERITILNNSHAYPKDEKYNCVQWWFLNSDSPYPCYEPSTVILYIHWTKCKMASKIYVWTCGSLKSMSVMTCKDNRGRHMAFLQCEFWCASSNFLGLSICKDNVDRQKASLQCECAHVLWY